MIKKNSWLVLVLLFHTLLADPSNADDIIREITFIPPNNGEEPETKGAGTRNPESFKCVGDTAEIMPIMPDNNYGLTTQVRPKIFFLIPETTAKQVVISFQDREEKYQETAFFSIDSDSTLNSFSLPEHHPELENDINYQWKLTLVCGDIPSVNDPILTGWIKRISLETQSFEFERQTTIEKAQWYGANGYWYDLLHQIFLLKEEQTKVECNSDIWQQLIDRY